MKKLVLFAAALCCLTASTVNAQGTAKPAAAGAQPAAAATANQPVKIGLVDMARVFREYDKFNDMRTGLDAEWQESLEEIKAIAGKAKKVQEELALVKKGSPAFIEREAEIASLSSQFETKQKLNQVNFRRKHADMFEKVYIDARDVIKLYAEHFKFTMIMRFNSEALDEENPEKIASSINKLVVYHRPSDDITDAVIEYLNRKYAPSRPAVPKTATPAGAPGTPGTVNR